jgi:hypothetical protein
MVQEGGRERVRVWGEVARGNYTQATDEAQGSLARSVIILIFCCIW